MDLMIEELSINAWPALKTVVYDGWIIRLAEGFAHRANSVSPVYPSKINLDEKIRFCEKLYSGYNIPVSFKLVKFPGSKDHINAADAEHRLLEEKLEKLNYKRINETSIQTGFIKDIVKSSPRGVVIQNTFTSEWMEKVLELNNTEVKYVPVFKGILGNIAVDKIVAHKEINGEIAGVGCGVVERGYAGIFDIIVKEEYRRQGYAQEIVEAILMEAGNRGADKTYLQVMMDNAAALKLYKKMGYNESYRYWYRKRSLT